MNEIHCLKDCAQKCRRPLLVFLFAFIAANQFQAFVTDTVVGSDVKTHKIVFPNTGLVVLISLIS